MNRCARLMFLCRYLDSRIGIRFDSRKNANNHTNVAVPFCKFDVFVSLIFYLGMNTLQHSTIEIPDNVKRLTPYKPGRSIEDVQKELGDIELVKLASNENPFGPSPKASARIMEHSTSLHLYPNGGLTLREQLAANMGARAENMIAGGGSESVLQLALRTFMSPGDEMLSCSGTFVGYQVLATASGFTSRYVPLTDQYSFDIRGLVESISPKTKIIYIANPNNPTGTWMTPTEWDWFIQQVPKHVLVILDEAYYEYARHAVGDAYPDVRHWEHTNVLGLRTFSKVYGIAGVRIGYGIAHEDIITTMLKIKLPFDPSTLAQDAALGALEDTEYLQKTLETNTEALRILTAGFSALGVSVPPSAGNFVVVPCGSDAAAEQFTALLLKQGIIVRHLPGFGLPDCVRISTGTVDQTKQCMETVARVLNSEPEMLATMRKATEHISQNK